MSQQITSPVTAALAGSPLDLIWNKPYHQATLQLLDSKVATKLTEQMLQAQRDLIRMEMAAHLSMATQQGYHPLTVARSMQNAMYEKLGSTQARMNNIARTEVLDAYRNGARQTQLANADVLQGWVWTSVVAQTSCPSCIAMHGTVHDLSEPGPEDHPQGRCFRVPLTKPWPQLGFDVEEPASTFVDAQSWFGSLTPQQQHAMLGEKAYAAWSSGKFPMKDWAQRVENDKWRGFYRPAKPGHVGPARKMIDDLPKVAVREEYDGMVTFYDQNGNELAKIKKAEPQVVPTVPGAKPKSPDDGWENQLLDLQPVEKKAAWVKANEAKVAKLPAGDGEWQLNKDTWVIRKDGKISYRREWHGFARTYDEFGNMTGKYKLAVPESAGPKIELKTMSDLTKENLTGYAAGDQVLETTFHTWYKAEGNDGWLYRVAKSDGQIVKMRKTAAGVWEDLNLSFAKGSKPWLQAKPQAKPPVQSPGDLTLSDLAQYKPGETIFSNTDVDYIKGKLNDEIYTVVKNEQLKQYGALNQHMKLGADGKWTGLGDYTGTPWLETPKPAPFATFQEITPEAIAKYKPGDLLWEAPGGKTRWYKGQTSKSIIKELVNQHGVTFHLEKYSLTTGKYVESLKELDLKFALKKPAPGSAPQPVVAPQVPAPKMGTPKSSYTDVWDEKFSTGKVGEKFDIDTNNKAEIVNANGQAKYVVHNKQADHYFLLDKDGYIVDGPKLLSKDLDLKASKHKFTYKFNTQYAHQKPSYGYGGTPPKTTAYNVESIKPADYQPPKPYRDYMRSKPAERPVTPKGQAPISEQQWLHLEHNAPSSLRDYRRDGYSSINGSFRKGHPNSSARSLASHIEDRGYTFQNDTYSFRGVKAHPGYDPGTWGVGSVQTEAGFMSTSSNFETAVDFSGARYGSNGWVLKVNAKAGQKWVPGTDYEYELLFAPGLRFRVLKKDAATHTMEIELL